VVNVSYLGSHGLKVVRGFVHARQHLLHGVVGDGEFGRAGQDETHNKSAQSRLHQLLES
jgi:hypothetical protein